MAAMPTQSYSYDSYGRLLNGSQGHHGYTLTPATNTRWPPSAG
ncbi:MAG: hypothetical protein R2867_12535 [Caldilineaceae bacterium]